MFSYFVMLGLNDAGNSTLFLGNLHGATCALIADMRVPGVSKKYQT